MHKTLIHPTVKKFVSILEQEMNKQEPTKFKIMYGKKYIKIKGRWAYYCFIDYDGDIFTPHTSFEAVPFVRGNIFNGNMLENILENMSLWGPADKIHPNFKGQYVTKEPVFKL